MNKDYEMTKTQNSIEDMGDTVSHSSMQRKEMTLISEDKLITEEMMYGKKEKHSSQNSTKLYKRRKNFF
jgi:hypothetical protein